jgi:hypothetical protein
MALTFRSWLLALSCSFVLGLLPVGCGSDTGKKSRPELPTETGPERVVATILLANDTLTLLDLREVDPNALPPAPAKAPLVQWRYESESGVVLASGTMKHPLVATSEFENGVPKPITFLGGASLFQVELPNEDGMFVLSDDAVVGSGTKPQSWTTIQEKLKLFIKKLLGKFEFEKASGAGGVGAGAGEAYSLLVVGDGYTQEEEAKFNQDVQNVVSVLSVTPGFKENWQHMSVWQRFFHSRESGISHACTGVVRDTAFRVTHPCKEGDPGWSRAIWMADDVSANTLAKLAATQGETGAHVTLVLANTTAWGGAANSAQRIGFFAANGSAGSVAGHEIGHALWGLEDEYDYGTCNPANFEPLGPNVALGSPYPWESLLTKGVTLPTTDTSLDVVGAYEGAIYCASGAYRPQYTCFMRELGPPFCKVCRAHVQQEFASRTLACHPKTDCAHAECATGDALNKSCSPCASAVCLVKPECCDPTNGWTEECVDAAKDMVGACRGICAGGPSSCGHSECDKGVALDASCSTCAESVCKKDELCCVNVWDFICAMEAERDPFCSCPAE